MLIWLRISKRAHLVNELSKGNLAVLVEIEASNQGQQFLVVAERSVSLKNIFQILEYKDAFVALVD